MASEDLPANGYGGPADPPAQVIDKRYLRRALRAARGDFVAGLALDERTALEGKLAAILTASLSVIFATLQYKETGQPSVASYAASGSEIDPGSSEVFPRVGTGTLTFHRCTRASLVPGFANIAEPLAAAPEVDPGIILVPLVAVDRRGNRLGQGAGHYDRTLVALRARRQILVVGIAWDMQLVDSLPADPWDEPLDALATPSRWLTFPRCPPMSRG